MQLIAVKSVRAISRSWMLRALPLLALALAGCVSPGMDETPDPAMSARDREYLALAPHVDVAQEFGRYLVDDPTGQPPGTIIVDTKDHFLYYVLPKKKALRYGIATGGEAYGWTGNATVGRKEEWPHWMPPSDMVAALAASAADGCGGRSPGRSGKSARCARALSLPGR